MSNDLNHQFCHIDENGKLDARSYQAQKAEERLSLLEAFRTDAFILGQKYIPVLAANIASDFFSFFFAKIWH